MVKHPRISHEEAISGKWQYTQHTAGSDGGWTATVWYNSDGTINVYSYTKRYREEHKLGEFAEQNNDTPSAGNNGQQGGSAGGFFATVLLAAASEAEKKGKSKPITKHAQKPTLKQPGQPTVKKAVPIPKRQIGKPIVCRTSLSSSVGGSLGTSSPKKKLFAGTKPAKPKPIKPAKPVASVSKKRAITSGMASRPTAKRPTTSTKSGGMFGGSSSSSSKKSGGMFGGGSSSSSKKSGGMFGGVKKRR